jgi:AraC-like DNA-binding protein
VEKVVIFSPVKEVKLSIVRAQTGESFQIHRLGLHERMRPGMVNRPGGTGDYLFMAFHSPVNIQSENNEPWPASTMIIWTPQDGHYYGNKSIDWSHSWFHCSGPAVARILEKNRLTTNQPFPAVETSALEHYITETMAELNGWQEMDEVILQNIFENYVRTQARLIFSRKDVVVPPGLQQVRTYLENGYLEDLRLPEVARQAGWSVPHLCTEFRRYFGMPVMQYVQQLRMSQATYLLRDHNLRISEIAESVGYSDLYTFSKVFKRRFGVSPRNYRNEV